MSPPPGPSSHDIAAFPPPNGWTNAKEDLDIDYYWASSTGDGQVMAQKYGLKAPTPIMCKTRQSGDCLYMFQSDNSFYLWNQIESLVMKITKPADLNGIVAAINSADGGVKPLTVVEVPQVSASSRA